MNLNIPLNECIISTFKDPLRRILRHEKTHYVFKGGRGSTKSSFIAIAIVLLIMKYPKVHAAVFRKVGNTLKNSVFEQIAWAITKLGVDSLFKVPKSISSPIIYKPTGQRILFFGLDDPGKVKSVKVPFGYIGITWFSRYASDQVKLLELGETL